MSAPKKMPNKTRDEILGAIRARTASRSNAESVAARLAAHAPGPLPARARVGRDERIALFIAMAEAVSASVARLAAMNAAPEAIAGWLAENNLPAEAAIAPDPMLESLPWDRAPMLALRPGPARGSDAVGITGAFAGIAETGTLMLLSGPDHPSTLNFLPDTHIVVLAAARIVGTYEDGFARMRARGAMPRTVNFVTGPSRTADIEQTIQLGAHGPRRLHILVVDDPDAEG